MLVFRKRLIIFQVLSFFIFFLLRFSTPESFLLDITLAITLLLGTNWILLKTSRSIEEISLSIKDYALGKTDSLKPIVIHERDEELDLIAFTLNSLSERIAKELKKIQRQKMEYEFLLESLDEGVIGVEKNGTVLYANKVALHFLDLSKEKCIGFPLSSIPVSELAEMMHNMYRQVIQSNHSCSNFWNFPIQNKYFRILAFPYAYRGGVVFVIQDKSADQKFLQMGKEFIANASHELRTPITIIHGFSETLQDFEQLKPEQRKEIIEKIRKTSFRLDKLLKSLLTLSGIERGISAEFRKIDGMKVVEESIESLRILFPEAIIDWDGPTNLVEWWGDAELLQIAISNLVENGIKYSPIPARISIHIEEKMSGWHLSIKDQGIGIPQADLEHIFDRFYRVDKARSRKSGGVGLGLSIVKKVVELHQGTIRVESSLGEGTNFILTLPFAKEFQSSSDLL
jgi:two-component system phosphate regulon sensor histidine kinase PhoR